MFTQISYNNTINALIEWGKVKMTQPDLQEILALHEESIRGFLVGYDSASDEITEWTHLIKTPIEGCKKLFQNIAIIEADPGETLHHSVEESFTRFDHLVFFNCAIEKLLLEKYVNECSTAKIDCNELCATTASAVDELAAWVYESVSPLRLIPFNEIRKPSYEFIQEQYRFLFPWYELMIDAPSDLLIQFEHHFHVASKAVLEGGALTELKQLFGEDALLYIQELRADTELFSALKQNVFFGEQIRQVIADHPEIRLSRAADLVQQKKYLPAQYWEYPLVSLISKRLSQTVNLSEKVAWVFLSALVGPCPADHRIETFTWVLQEISKINRKECPDKNLSAILDCFDSYLNNKVNVDSMCEQVFGLWEKVVAGVVKGEAKAVEDMSLEDFWMSLQNSMKAPANVTKERTSARVLRFPSRLPSRFIMQGMAAAMVIFALVAVIQFNPKTATDTSTIRGNTTTTDPTKECRKAVELYNQGTEASTIAQKEQFLIQALDAGCSEKMVLAKIYNNLADCHETQGKIDEAVKGYNKALKLDPQLYTAHWGLGDIYKKIWQQRPPKGSWFAFLSFMFDNSDSQRQAAIENYNQALTLLEEAKRRGAPVDEQIKEVKKNIDSLKSK